MAEATLITVLRHGEVAGRAHVFRGRSDEPLTERGRAQVLAVADRIGPLTRIAASPLRRCRDVAATLAEVRGLALAILPDMAEMDFGAWEGASVAEIAAAHPETYAAFHCYADHAVAPGGETLVAFRQRVVAAWEAWSAAEAGGHGLLLCHAGVMRILLQHLLAIPPGALSRFALPEAAQFQVSLLPGHAAILMRLNTCADFFSPSSS
ncbi:MAG: histidine phosphatase family protein [Gallionellaceae bacterium]|nr:histidine phosphatase family protein [Gallionellaceae bacterium]